MEACKCRAAQPHLVAHCTCHWPTVDLICPPLRPSPHRCLSMLSLHLQVDDTCIMPHDVLLSSGHVERFNDFIVKVRECFWVQSRESATSAGTLRASYLSAIGSARGCCPQKLRRSGGFKCYSRPSHSLARFPKGLGRFEQVLPGR